MHVQAHYYNIKSTEHYIKALRSQGRASYIPGGPTDGTTSYVVELNPSVVAEALDSSWQAAAKNNYGRFRNDQTEYDRCLNIMHVINHQEHRNGCQDHMAGRDEKTVRPRGNSITIGNRWVYAVGDLRDGRHPGVSSSACRAQVIFIRR